MSFGEKLREYRKRKGYTQQELARLIGVAKSTLTGYEKGNREPDVNKIKSLAKALGVTGDELLGITQDSSAPSLTPTAHRIGRAYEKATPPVQRIVEVALEPYMQTSDAETADELVPEVIIDGEAIADPKSAAELAAIAKDIDREKRAAERSSGLPSEKDA